MLTNNWNSLLQAILRGINNVTMVSTTNNNFESSRYYNNGLYGQCRQGLYKVADTSGIDRIGSGIGEHWLLIGAGDKEVTPNDYTLNSPINGDKYNVITQVSDFSPPPSSVFLTITRVVENISNENLVVNEVGYFMRYENATSFMVAREVLPEPVIIKPGERHSFTMAISVS
mgnify:CR=1 FL=1